MPNWCENRVKITGDNLDKLIEVIEKDKGYFVSESFIQTPKELRKDTGLTKEELIEKFGFDDWYEWNCENLGTKWEFESCGDVVLEEGRIEFFCSTAWAPPIPFFEKISAMYNCEVDIKYAETGMWFSGREIYKNGELVDGEEFDTCYTECGLEALGDDLFYMLDDEDDIEILLNLSDEEKEAILASDIVADEIKELLLGVAA